MALGRAKPGSLRHLFDVLINITVEDRYQRLDVEHIPAYRQIAFFQLLRQRRELTQFVVKIGQDTIHHRLRRTPWQRCRHRIQLLHRGARRGGVDSGDNQPVHLH